MSGDKDRKTTRANVTNFNSASESLLSRDSLGITRHEQVEGREGGGVERGGREGRGSVGRGGEGTGGEKRGGTGGGGVGRGEGWSGGVWRGGEVKGGERGGGGERWGEGFISETSALEMSPARGIHHDLR